MAGMSHLWESNTFSDATVVLKLSVETSSAESTPKVLRRLPGNRALLSASPVLRAKLETPEECDIHPPKRPRNSTSEEPDVQQQYGYQQIDKQQPEATLILDSEEQEPAAMAVLASLYGVSTPPEQLTDLQQLHAIKVADMLQVPAAAEAAVSNLVSIATDPAKGLSDAAQQCFCSMQAWPPSLLAALPRLTKQLPLLDAAGIWARAAAPSSPSSLEAVQAAPHSSYMQDRLLQELGDLEEVWKDAERKKQLLGLPLAAMQLLLGSSQLMIATEDTVLFTAQVYAEQQRQQQEGNPWQAAQQQLMQLIRCPYLSPFWLTAAARDTANVLLLALLKNQLLELLAFRMQCRSTQLSITAAETFEELVPDAPSSWLLGPRQPCAPAASVQVSWELPVSQLKEWCLEAAAKQERIWGYSPNTSAPLRGIAFQLALLCDYTSDGVTVGVCVGPKLAVPDMFVGFSATVESASVSKKFTGATLNLKKWHNGWGFANFFQQLGPMRDGWDAVAWARKRLPTAGNLVINATVSLDGEELAGAPRDW